MAEEDGPPPGISGPPGLFAPKSSSPPGNAAASAPGLVKPAGEGEEDLLAKTLAEVKVSPPEEYDEPDLALRGYKGLQENPDAKIQTSSYDNTIYSSAATFEELGLSKELLQGIYSEMGFEKPSKIQATTLPMILTPPFRDLIAQAHNGSGKTTCFVLAMLSRVNTGLAAPQALCVCPTRELVVQNLHVCQKMGKYTSIKAVSSASEVGARETIHQQVVIGTHGKLQNWVRRRQLSLDSVAVLVFDEADEMLRADAFADDSVRMIKTIRTRNPAVQLLLFSATFNDRVKDFAVRIAPRANQVFVPKEELSLDVISQFNVRCPTRVDKQKVLQNMIFPNCEKLGQTIIFVRTREAARTLHSEMEKLGYRCTSIEGSMLHEVRDKVVQEFRDGSTKILIATDVLSRGFDVSQVTLVINYDVPVERDQRTPNYETYLHRIGRSGRFGRKGAAFNLIVGQEDERQMAMIAQYFNKFIPEVAYDDEDGFLAVLRSAGLTT